MKKMLQISRLPSSRSVPLSYLMYHFPPLSTLSSNRDYIESLHCSKWSGRMVEFCQQSIKTRLPTSSLEGPSSRDDDRLGWLRRIRDSRTRRCLVPPVLALSGVLDSEWRMGCLASVPYRCSFREGRDLYAWGAISSLRWITSQSSSLKRGKSCRWRGLNREQGYEKWEQTWKGFRNSFCGVMTISRYIREMCSSTKQYLESVDGAYLWENRSILSCR